MNMDTKILNWMLEYLLRQPLEDRQIKFLIRACPLPNDNFNLKKLLMWKVLESEVSSGSVCEKTLDRLEHLEEIEFQQGNENVSDSMKHAYCAVAVECTLKHFFNGNDDGEHSKRMKLFEFYGLVKRVWKWKVERLHKMVEKGGLGSEELWLWKDEIEASLWDEDVFESVLKKSQGLNAVVAVRDYLRVEREKLGPSYLEMIAAAQVKNSDALRRILEFGSVDVVAGDETLDRNVSAEAGNETPGRNIDTPGRNVDQATNVANVSNGGGSVDVVAGDETLDCNVNEEAGNETPGCSIDTPGRNVDQATDVANVSNGEMQTERIQLRKKSAGVGHSRRRPSRGAKLVDHDETTLGSSPSTSEFNRIRGDLASSAAELRALVKDPLPEAMQMAEAISNAAGENKCHDLNNLEIKSGAEIANDHSVSYVAKPSLMEPNSSAHTYEWDESQGDPHRDRILLPTPPRTVKIAPLDIHEGEKKVKKRRKARKWSLQEEDTLRKGVEEYGIGNWKIILTKKRDMFQDRTEVDLKDKWRNMIH